MLRGTIATKSKLGNRGFTIPQTYTLFVFDDALVMAPLGPGGRLWWMAGYAGGHAVDIVANQVEKRQRSKVEATAGELPPDITPEQLIEQVRNAHSVPAEAVSSVTLKTVFFPLPLSQFRGTFVNFKFASKKDVDPYVYRRLRWQEQFLSGDTHTSVELLTGLLGDKVRDKRRSLGKR